ncbi:unnamed protein product [Blepharisma stoltei]|uniref:Kinesin-like protein n=1 Tax=Blepharisma stoltei TaxID=1481888 RepID=A0AAU9J2S1_9CILI|nr:unnamed protein product [Blepharisma stoltei]
MNKEEPRAFKVYVRIRPPSERELLLKQISCEHYLRVQDEVIWIKEQRSSLAKEYSYSFDGVFTESHNNSIVYTDSVSLLVSQVLQGFNATTFAYGTTGAGKTHTMFGNMMLEGVTESGILYLALEDCFSQINAKRSDFILKLSYLEIYNEHVIDLLDSTGKSNNLLIVEDPIKGIVVPELLEYQISNLQDAHELIVKGNQQRTMASTAINQFSTRSHAVLRITIEQRARERNIIEEVANSKLSLIDLAGSERGAATENRGQRMVEGANINRSLLALGNCINILTDSKNKGKYVPYRDSKLTRILKDSLGGNTKTIMIACISPSIIQFEETMNTLKYAERARNIKNDAVRNIKEVEAHVSEYKEIIQSLRQEIEFLKVQLNRQEESSPKQSFQTEQTSAKSPIKRVRTQAENSNLNLDDSEFDVFSKRLLDNFEEHWEIKNSIKEIDMLNQENNAKLKQYIGQSESGISNRNMREFRNELQALQQNIKENEDMRNELLESLYSNLKVKTELQNSIGNMKVDKKREILELQIALRNLKLEKLDLHIQNTQIKQEALKVKQESEAKDKIISQMKSELDTMKKQLTKQAALPRRKDIYHSASTNSFHKAEDYPKLQNDLSQEFVTSFGYVSSPKTQKIIKLSGLDEARRARKLELQSLSSSKKNIKHQNSYIPNHPGDIDEVPDKKIEVIRSSSVSGSRPMSSKLDSSKNSKKGTVVHTSVRGVFSNLQKANERFLSADRRRATPKEERPKAEDTKIITIAKEKTGKDIKKKEEVTKMNLSKLAKSLNQRILTAEEAAEIVRQQWRKKPTPLVKISLSKM